MPDAQDQGFAKLFAMIETLKIGMLTTEDSEGLLRSRPMATQPAEEGKLWFLTADDAPKTGEVHDAPQVNVSYAGHGREIFVSVSGIARTSRDRAKLASFGAAKRSAGFLAAPTTRSWPCFRLKS